MSHRSSGEVPIVLEGETMLRTIIITTFAAATLSATLVPNAVAGTKGNASRETIERNCDAMGGQAWGTGASSGSYGCITDTAAVYCTEGGECEGITPEIRRPDTIGIGAGPASKVLR
jgi:hypothetical protein